MSRVGKRILTIPENVEVSLDENTFKAKGKLGELERTFSPLITIEINDNQISTTRKNELKTTKQLHGTTNSLIENILEGVSKGFKKELVIKGVGYKAILKNQTLEIAAGYSHLVNLEIPSEIKVEVPKATEIIVSGIDKEKVGQFAAIVHDVRKPNPYSGKGITYKNEVIRRKEGKTATK